MIFVNSAICTLFVMVAQQHRALLLLIACVPQPIPDRIVVELFCLFLSRLLRVHTIGSMLDQQYWVQGLLAPDQTGRSKVAIRTGMTVEPL